jgi:hypothetical protein
MPQVVLARLILVDMPAANPYPTLAGIEPPCLEPAVGLLETTDLHAAVSGPSYRTEGEATTLTHDSRKHVKLFFGSLISSRGFLPKARQGNHGG